MPLPDFILVIAEVRLLATAEGGKSVPIRGSYRPNHNFFDEADAVMTAGFIEIPDGQKVEPGEAIVLQIALWWWPGWTGRSIRGASGGFRRGRRWWVSAE